MPMMMVSVLPVCRREDEDEAADEDEDDASVVGDDADGGHSAGRAVPPWDLVVDASAMSGWTIIRLRAARRL